MKILILIPARGSSKRILNKNIRILGKKPLIVWTIEIAKKILGICDVLVSTDDSSIATISKEAGALVPWLRPSILSTDFSNSVDVSIHAIDMYENEKQKIDALLLLEPTSPFRNINTIQKGIKLFQDNNFKPVLGVSPSYSHPMWAFKLENNYLIPYMKNHGLNKRSQDLPEVYNVNGNFYLIKTKDLKSNKSFISKETLPLIISNPKESLNIDDERDWDLAEYFINHKTNK